MKKTMLLFAIIFLGLASISRAKPSTPSPYPNAPELTLYVKAAQVAGSFATIPLANAQVRVVYGYNQAIPRVSVRAITNTNGETYIRIPLLSGPGFNDIDIFLSLTGISTFTGQPISTTYMKKDIPLPTNTMVTIPLTAQ